MAEGRGRLEWAQTSQLLAMLYNVNRGAKTPAAKPEDFNPYTPQAKPSPKASMKSLGQVLKPRLQHGQ